MKTRVERPQAADAHGAAAGEHHVLPLSVYFGVFGTLLVLTVVTVFVSTLGLPPTLSIVVAMAVAIVKALLVVMYFMHLKYDLRFHALIFAASLFFIGLFFALTIWDLSYRDLIIPEQGNGVLQQWEPPTKPGGAAK